MSTLQPDQLARLRNRLEERDRALRTEIEETRPRPDTIAYSEIVGRVRDSGEDSVANHEADLRHFDVARDAGELHEIAAALERMRDGEYGFCESCGGDIDPARLEAQPTASRCLRCQSLHEKTHAGQQAPTL